MINIKVLDIRSKKEIPFMLTLTGNNEVTLLIDTYEINTANKSTSNFKVNGGSINNISKITEENNLKNLKDIDTYQKYNIHEISKNNIKTEVSQMQIISSSEISKNPELANEINSFFKTDNFTNVSIQKLKNNYKQELRSLESKFINGCPSCKKNALVSKYISLLRKFYISDYKLNTKS